MPQERSRVISLKKRLGSFKEVHLGLSKADAVENARIFLERERAVKGAPCPLTPDFFAVLRPLAKGDARAAAAVLLQTNPLPGLTARLAPEPFAEMQVYNRKAEQISLRAIERFLAVHVRAGGDDAAVPGKKQLKVAVIGSGPTGLAAAAYLNRQGFVVTVIESSAVIGGSLVSQIGEFRLPRKAVDLSVRRLRAEGIEFRTNILFPRQRSAEELFEEEGFSALLLAVGASVPDPLGIPQEGAAGVISASALMRWSRQARWAGSLSTLPPFLGNKIVIAGHDELAIDAARTAVRMGRSVTVVIAGSENDIRVAPALVREAAEEGVKFRAFTSPVEVRVNTAGCVKALSCRHLDYRVDSAGRLNVVEEEDAAFDLEADTIVFSKGSAADTLFVREIPGLDLNLDGSVWVRPDSCSTSVRKIYAAGHAARPGMSFIETLQDARRAAQEISAYLNA